MFLTRGPALSDTRGSEQTFAEMKVTSEQKCPDRGYTTIGTWVGALTLD